MRNALVSVAIGCWALGLPAEARAPSRRDGEGARVTALVRQALLGALPHAARKVVVEALRVPLPRRSEQYVRATVELRARERYRGPTSFAVLLRGAAGEDVPATRVWASASLRVRVPTWVAARDLRAGHTLTASDLEEVDRLLDATSEPGIASLEAAVGQKLQRALRAFDVVRARDLRKAAVVRRGAYVQVVAHFGGLRVQSRGRALGEGAVGDTVAVERLGSRKKVLGRVSGRDLVTVEF